MKTGRPIAEVLGDIQKQADLKRDYIVPTAALTMTPANTLELKGNGAYDVTNHTHSQLAEWTDIGKKYYDRMREHEPELLATNVNRWFQKQPARRMLRTITMERPTARAFMSDSYRRLDNFDLAQAILPFIHQQYGKALTVASCELTESRFYLKIIAPHTERDLATLLAPGTHSLIHEPVQAGFIIQNSEIGMGAISVFPFTLVLRCTNGMTVEEYGQRKYHSGKRNQGGDDENDFLLSDQTKALDDAAFWSRVRDTVKACLTEDTALKVFTRMAEARNLKIDKAPEEVIEVLGNNYGLSETQRTSVLRTLIDSGQGLTQYGLANAITTMAQDDGLDYDEATRIETLGGRIINLDPSQWKVLSTAEAAKSDKTRGRVRAAR